MLERFRGAVSRILNVRRTGPERQQDVRVFYLGGQVAGVRMTSPEDMMKVATVSRCVNLIANSVASLKAQVCKRDEIGNSEAQPAHDVDWLLNNLPNPEMTAFDLKRAILRNALTWGDGYAEIERNAAGRPVALWHMRPDRTDPIRDADGRLWYRYQQPSGGTLYLPPRDVIHIKNTPWDGVAGSRVYEIGGVSISSAIAADNFAANFFGQGMSPGGVVEAPAGARLTPEGIARLEQKFAERHQGFKNAWKPLILDQDMKWKPLSIEPDKGQFLETRKFTVYDICRWFGVPPYLAFASDEEPRANVETQSREFYSFGLLPWITAFEQEVNWKMLNNQHSGFHIKVNTDALLRGDLKSRAEGYQLMRNMGVFTINDVLRMEGMDTIGPEGDARHMQSQYGKIGKDGEVEPPHAPAQESQPDAPPPAVTPAKNGRALHG